MSSRSIQDSALRTLEAFGMALSDSLLPALGFRALAGIAMAGMYMPGLRAEKPRLFFCVVPIVEFGNTNS